MIAGEIRYVGKETDRKWEEGGEISILEFAATEYGRKGKVVASVIFLPVFCPADKSRTILGFTER